MPRFVPAFELVIDGASPQPFLRQMEKSGAVRVLGPQIDGIHYGTPGAMRMVVRVEAASVAAARQLIEAYLPADQGFKVKPVIRGI